MCDFGKLSLHQPAESNDRRVCEVLLKLAMHDASDPGSSVSANALAGKQASELWES